MSFGAASGSHTVVGNTVASVLTGVSVGDTIVVHTSRDASVTFVSLTDDKSTSYAIPTVSSVTASLLDANNGELHEVFVGVAGSAGTFTITLTLSGALGDGCMLVSRHSGRSTTSPVVAVAINAQYPPVGSNPGTGVGDITCGPFAVPAGADILLNLSDASGAHNTNYSATAGYTLQREEGAAGVSALQALITKDNTSGTQSATATQANTTPCGSIVIVLAQASGGASVVSDEDANAGATSVRAAMLLATSLGLCANARSAQLAIANYDDGGFPIAAVPAVEAEPPYRQLVFDEQRNTFRRAAAWGDDEQLPLRTQIDEEVWFGPHPEWATNLIPEPWSWDDGNTLPPASAPPDENTWTAPRPPFVALRFPIPDPWTWDDGTSFPQQTPTVALDDGGDGGWTPPRPIVLPFIGPPIQDEHVGASLYCVDEPNTWVRTVTWPDPAPAPMWRFAVEELAFPLAALHIDEETWFSPLPEWPTTLLLEPWAWDDGNTLPPKAAPPEDYAFPLPVVWSTPYVAPPPQHEEAAPSLYTVSELDVWPVLPTPWAVDWIAPRVNLDDVVPSPALVDEDPSHVRRTLSSDYTPVLSLLQADEHAVPIAAPTFVAEEDAPFVVRRLSLEYAASYAALLVWATDEVVPQPSPIASDDESIVPRPRWIEAYALVTPLAIDDGFVPSVIVAPTVRPRAFFIPDPGLELRFIPDFL